MEGFTGKRENAISKDCRLRLRLLSALLQAFLIACKRLFLKLSKEIEGAQGSLNVGLRHCFGLPPAFNGILKHILIQLHVCLYDQKESDRKCQNI